MLKSQSLSLKISETRQALNALSGKAEPSDDDRTKLAEHRTALDKLETEYRDAVKAEDDETRHKGGAPGDDGEAAEFRSLAGKVRLTRYMGEIAAGTELGGETAEAELRAACDLPRGLIPWAAFDPGERRDAKDATGEKRADTATAAPGDIAATQDEILGRVFARTAAMFLGVRMVNVARGDAVYPVITEGRDAAVKAAGDAHEAGAATIASTTLDRRRATARYIFRLEDAAGMGDTLEMALRSDMRMAIAEQIDKQILSGDGVAPNVSGFLDPADGPLTIPATDPDTVATFALVVAAAADGVEGRYAANLAQIRVLLNGDAYGRAAAAFTSTGDISGTDYLMRNSGGIRASANMPATASNIALGLLYRSGADGASAVAPMWQGLQVYRDDATRIAQGEIAVTGIALFNFAVLRAAAYGAFKLKTG